MRTAKIGPDLRLLPSGAHGVIGRVKMTGDESGIQW